MNNNDVLICQDLCKTYGSKVALDKITLSLGRGKIIGLLGPNGSGKTTLIKLAAGLLMPTSGSISINGMTPSDVTKAQVAYLPDRTYFDESMNVEAILAMFSDFYTDFDETKARKMISNLKIDTTQRLKEMSKGTKEKVQLIMVMSREASLYLLDEPIGGVDPAARDYILNTIIGNYNENATVVISTHLIGDVEKVLDEVVFIKDGEFVLHESVDDIRETKEKSVDELFREVFKC